MTQAEDYRIYYYIDSRGKESVKEYINKLSEREQIKVFTYLELLKDRKESY